MQTNANISVDNQLEQKAKALLLAAYEFWQEHQRVCGPNAVVWLKDTSGHFILFTRGEYKDDIMHNIEHISSETPMSGAFTVKTEK